MSAQKSRSFRTIAFMAAIMGATLACGTPSEARVTAIVTDSRAPAFDGVAIGSAGPYETLRGRVFGELDPGDPHNTIIQDIQLAPKNANGKVPYIATFQVTKPVEMSLGNQLMVYEVSNRGGNAIPTSAGAIIPGAVYVQSGWQGDLLSQCATAYPCISLNAPYTGNQQVIQVPVAVNADGSSLTGPVYGHIVSGTGTTQQMIIKSTPIPYKPLSLDTKQASLWSLTSQSITGVDSAKTPIASSDWAWADCRSVPFPGTPDPTRICLRDGFNPALLYEMVFTAKDPLVLGVGYAATRDVISFFHHAAADDHGTANPVTGGISKVISIGSSQSGAFIRSSIHLGFNQDESGQQVVDGAWPQIDGRQLYLNVRFALPDVDMTMYMPADESPVWWAHYPDKARNLPASGMLDRCTATETCPQILETFGTEEFWDLKMSPNLVGTTAEADIPLPANVARYYLPGVTHGGGTGGFTWTPNPAPASGCTLPANANPISDTHNAVQDDFVAWVMNGTKMPPSVYPTLSDGQLVPPTQAATGFPQIPGFPFHEGLINPLIDYDFGPQLDERDQTGIITIQPPRIKQVLPTYVPKVNADGNEVGGVSSVLHQAPLGTYTGWNIVATPTPGAPFPGQICVNTGAFFPFKETTAQRTEAGDPRASLEERYGTHAGYVCAVTTAAKHSVRQRFLRASAATALIGQAQAGNVLTDISPTPAGEKRADNLCAMAASP
jgi:Alpha/beta hydrolase domain